MNLLEQLESQINNGNKIINVVNINGKKAKAGRWQDLTESGDTVEEFVIDYFHVNNSINHYYKGMMEGKIIINGKEQKLDEKHLETIKMIKEKTKKIEKQFKKENVVLIINGKYDKIDYITLSEYAEYITKNNLKNI